MEDGCNMRIVYRISRMVCFAAVICCCSKEIAGSEDNGGTGGTGQEEVTLEVPDVLLPKFEEVGTRALLGEEMKMAWHADDALSYFIDICSNVRYRFDGVTGDRQGTFSKVSDGHETEVAARHNYAVYPYSDSTYMLSEGVFSYVFPSVQEYAADSFSQNINVMVAVSQSAEDHDVHFRNCCGYLRVGLYGAGQTVKSVELAGNGSEPLAGKAELSVNRSGMPEVSICYDASMTLTLDCGEGVVLSSDQDKPTSFWFVIPPVDFSDGLRITVSDGMGHKFSKMVYDPVAVDRNSVKTMNAFEVEFGSLISFADISGSWRLDKWNGSVPPFNVSMEINDDGTIVLWQRIDDYSWERYDSEASLDMNVISGTYSDGVPWSACYSIQLDGEEMIWTNTEDESDVSVYVRTSLP